MAEEYDKSINELLNDKVYAQQRFRRIFVVCTLMNILHFMLRVETMVLP